MAVGFSEPTVVTHDRTADSLAGVLVVLQSIKERDDVAQFTVELSRLEDSIRELVATAPRVLASAQVALLTKRELNVLHQVAAGLSNKQVARRLGISERTVRNHLTHIFGKLGVMTRTEAVVSAVRAGILTL